MGRILGREEFIMGAQGKLPIKHTWDAIRVGDPPPRDPPDEKPLPWLANIMAGGLIVVGGVVGLRHKGM